MSLKDILCQERAIESLQRAMRLERLSHAYISAGADGVGRFKLAFEWAKLLLCENPQQSDSANGSFLDSCGQCQSCHLMDSKAHPDFKHIYKELIRFTSKSENRNKTPIDLPKDVVQEFLIDQVANKPKMGKKVIYIVSEAEKLNAASQNALLKTLEEPPAFCVIILLCTRLDKLLPTTLSRCQTVRFGPIDEEIIVEKLSQNGVNRTQSLYWARFTDGSLGEAMELSSLDIEGGCYGVKMEVVDRLSLLTVENSLEFAEILCEKSKLIAKKWSDMNENISKSDISRRAQKVLIRMLMCAMLDAMKISIGDDDKLANSDQKNHISRIAQRFDVDNCAESVQNAYQSINWVESSVNERLIFEELLLKFADSAKM